MCVICEMYSFRIAYVLHMNSVYVYPPGSVLDGNKKTPSEDKAFLEGC